MAGGPIGGKGPNQVIEFAVDKRLVSADGIPAVVDEDSDGWWSGVQMGFASVPAVGAAATLALSVAISSTFQQNEEIAPQNVVDEEYSWQAPLRQPVPIFQIFAADDEIPRLTLYGYERWEVLALGDPPQPFVFIADDELAQLAPTPDEVYHWQAQWVTPALQLSGPVWDDAVPARLLEDEYSWIQPYSLRSSLTQIAVADEDIVPQAGIALDQEYVWSPPLLAPIQSPTQPFSANDELPPTPTLSGHEAWDAVPIGDPPQGYAFAADEEIVPQPVFHPEEDYWWSAAPKVTWPAGWAFSADDEIEIPAAPTLSGHEAWEVVPVGELPLIQAFSADDEIVPQAVLHADEDYWLNLRSYQAPPDLRVFIADDEITQLVLSEAVGSSSFPQRKRHTPVIKLWEFTEELPPVPTLSGHEQWQVIPIGELPIIQAFAADDEIVPPPPPLPIEESDWQVFTPAWRAPLALYLPEPDENQGTGLIAPKEPPKGGRHKKGRLAYVPDKPIPQVVPRAIFTADVESHLEFAGEVRVSVQLATTCSVDTVATHSSALLAAAAFDGSAELELDRTSEVGPLVGSGSSSTDHDVVGLAVGRPAARAELVSDPKNKRPLSDGEILEALEALSKLPKKRPPV